MIIYLLFTSFYQIKFGKLLHNKFSDKIKNFDYITRTLATAKHSLLIEVVYLTLHDVL